MASPKRATGDAFEERALKHLKRAGLTLVARNFNTRHGELDLVMRDAEQLVFVEVRYRQQRGFGNAAASVTPAKQARLVRAAALFLQTHPRLAQRACRFDVVAFDLDDGETRCTWLRGAFDAH